MMLLALQHGNSAMAAFAYGWHGALLCASATHITTGYRFGQLSLEVLRQYPTPEIEVRVDFVFNSYVRHWKEDLRLSIVALQDICRCGVETGELQYTYYAVIHYWSEYATNRRYIRSLWSAHVRPTAISWRAFGV
jgi:predicted ATPase